VDSEQDKRHKWNSGQELDRGREVEVNSRLIKDINRVLKGFSQNADEIDSYFVTGFSKL